MSRSRLRIQSDGRTSAVYVDGVLLDEVHSCSIEMEAYSSIVTLRLQGVPIAFDGPMDLYEEQSSRSYKTPPP